MKKIIFFVFICCIAVYFCVRFVFPKQKPSTNNYQLIINNSPSSYSSPIVSWNDITYGFEYFEVHDISRLTLIANFTQKKTSEFLVTENDCQYAINGGYYDTNNKPLGLFINPLLQTTAIESALVNGYVSVATKPAIAYDFTDNSTLAIQTGPMLLVDGIKLKLAIKNDEYARRMVAGITSKGVLIFLTIFIPETKVQGPKLADLPDIIEKINARLPNKILNAINLDGGNASMFKNSNISISEVSSVGSIFCLR